MSAAPDSLDTAITAAGVSSAIYIVKHLDLRNPGRWFTPPRAAPNSAHP